MNLRSTLSSNHILIKQFLYNLFDIKLIAARCIKCHKLFNIFFSSDFHYIMVINCVYIKVVDSVIMQMVQKQVSTQMVQKQELSIILRRLSLMTLLIPINYINYTLQSIFFSGLINKILLQPTQYTVFK